MTVKISAQQVAALRNRTGAGMMDCKKVLQETGGDIEKAVDLLRQRGIAKAEKRSGRGASEGVVGSYIHFNGRIGVLVEVNCETDFVALTDDFQQLVKDIALHVSAAKPIAVTPDDLPEDIVARERAIYEAQVAESGKPEQVRDKIIQGKMRKFYEERALMNQAFVKDDKRSIADVVKEVSGKLGENIVIRRFARFELGEE